ESSPFYGGSTTRRASCAASSTSARAPRRQPRAPRSRPATASRAPASSPVTSDSRQSAECSFTLLTADCRLLTDYPGAINGNRPQRSWPARLRAQAIAYDRNRDNRPGDGVGLLRLAERAAALYHQRQRGDQQRARCAAGRLPVSRRDRRI